MKQLGKYEIVDLIGSGAYAEVYKAVDTVLRRTVALKLLKLSLLSDDEAVARFLQEAQTAANLIHPHIAWVWDLGELDGRYYLAMRYIDGQPLDRVLKTKGQLSWDETTKYISQISDALTFAHAGSLVHRDIKPQNIMISPKDGAVLTDFGLVRAMEAGSIGTRTGALMGTPAYMAPEIWQGEPAGPAADQYSLACVLVEMLTGRPLFAGPTPPAVMRQHLLEGPRLPETLRPAWLTNVIRRALAQDPADRFPDIPAFVAALKQPDPLADARSEVRISDEQPVLEPEKPAANLPHTSAGLSPDAPVHSEPLPAAALKAASSQSATPPPPDYPRSSTQDRPKPGDHPRKTSPISRPRLPVWAIALICLGGFALLTILGPGLVRTLTGTPGTPATSVAVANPTNTSPPPATATVKPTTRPTTKPTAKPTSKPTTKPTSKPTATTDPTIPPACTEIGQIWISPIDGMTLVCVPAGDFLMGSTDTDQYASGNEKPQHTVYLDAYWIDQTEVTNTMFGYFVAATGYRTTAEEEGWGYAYDPDYRWGTNGVSGANWMHPSGPSSDLVGKDDHPVVQVTWEDAVAYCNWAGRQLPTEAQWEKAARGTDGRLYPWGNESPDFNRVNRRGGGTTVVGNYPAGASPYGALDMAGNVWELTSDWYDAAYYSSQTDWRNPAGPTSGEYRVERGGGYSISAARVRIIPGFSYSSRGFRCILNAVP